jgi:hypothetical protein
MDEIERIVESARAETMRECADIADSLAKNWLDASSGVGAVGAAFSNQASGAAQVAACIRARIDPPK